MRFIRRSTKRTDLESPAISHSTRRAFLKQTGLGAVVATSALVSGAQLFSPEVSSAATRGDFTHFHPNGKPSGTNVVLVHGLFADGSSWSKVIPLLQAQGHYVIASQNPLTSLPNDVTSTLQNVSQLRGPTILVGHSYGGMVITNAGLGASNIVGLVYISALIPAQGESLQSLSTYFGPGTRFILPPDQYGRVFVDQKGFHWAFAQDIDPEEANVLAAEQKPIQGTTFSDASGPPAWASLPSWCLISTNDRIIQPADQVIMANRAHATTIKVPSGHFSLVSHPNAVAELIEAAVRRTAKA